MTTRRRRILTVLGFLVLVAGGVALALLRRDGAPAEQAESGRGADGDAGTTSTVERPVADRCDESLKLQPSDQAYMGVAVPDGPYDRAETEAFTTAAGTSPALTMWFLDWETAFPVEAVQQAVDDGAVPVLAWEPTTAEAGSSTTDLPEYRLAEIAGGRHDDYIRQFARAAAEACLPVVLRPAAEMNGNWHPWAEGVNGNQPGEFVEAWRHVHDIFQAEDATNVTWLWNPNVVGLGSTPIAGLYPGDEYTDWVGLDGYNWGATQSWSRWESFSEVFDTSLVELVALTSRPVLIGEVASTEVGGDKAAWIADMYASIEAQPAIRGFVWFEYDKETDWRIVSSPEAEAAFARGAASAGIAGAPAALPARLG
jgi:hypothetical protein